MSAPLLVRGAHVILDGGISAVDVRCEYGRIVDVGPSLDGAAATVIDAAGLTLGPGFVDVHVHGGGGSSFFTRDASRLAAYSAWAPSHGVTAFLVSTAGRHPPDTARTLEGLAPAIGRAPGAESLGFHLEGPFLNPVRHGAFDPATLRKPAETELRTFLEAAEGKVRQVTLAPELPGSAALVSLLRDRHAMPAMGHSDATFGEASSAIAGGVGHVTHLFNAMRPLHQREGGIAAAALLDARVTCELICDGAHVSPEMLKLAWQTLGPRRMVAVTDNMHLAGTGRHHASFLGGDVDTRGNAAVRADGTIAGSVMPMDGHFRNLVTAVGLTLEEAFAVCSTNPARVAGAAGRKGKVAPGHDADLVLLDAGLSPVLTVCRGVVAYQRSGAAASAGDRPATNASSTV